MSRSVCSSSCSSSFSLKTFTTIQAYILFAVTGLFAVAASGQNLVVTTPNDDAGTAGNCTVQTSTTKGTDASCSLRDALAEAGLLGSANISFDTSVFSVSNYPAQDTITASYTVGPFMIPASTNINGPHGMVGGVLTNLVTVSGDGNVVFNFSPSQNTNTASLANLVVTGGNGMGSSGQGGGIFNTGTLTITGCAITGNTSPGLGGGIYSNGTLMVIDSTISGNNATFMDESGTGASAAGGGIENDGSQGPANLTIVNSTIANNSVNASTYYFGVGANANGGGIDNNGTLMVTGSTISGNSAQSYAANALSQPPFWGGNGGGINGSATLANTIVSGNTAYSEEPYPGRDPITVESDIGGYTDNGGNLVGLPYNTTLSNNLLAGLNYHGGQFETVLPLPGSPAICGGLYSNIPAGDTTDQRGYPRLNTVYPGYSADTPCVDSGSVQTNYSLSISSEPPSTAYAGTPMTPAPVVKLLESGVLAGAANSPVVETDTDGLLATGLSESMTAGVGTLNNLVFSGAAASDTLTFGVMLRGTTPELTATSTEFAIDAPTAPELTGPTPGTSLSGATTFSWTAGTGVAEFELRVGTNGPGSTDLFEERVPPTVTSISGINIPANGANLYEQLLYIFDNKWVPLNASFKEAGSPTLPSITSPLAGSVLSGPTTFTWSGGAGTTEYELRIGTTGPGTSDVADKIVPLGTSAISGINIPMNGADLYVRFLYRFNGVWTAKDSLYKEAGAPTPPVLTAPTGETLLGGLTTFTWVAGKGITEYLLRVGTTAQGSEDLCDKAVPANVTSVQNINIPRYGAPVYVDLDYQVNGVWTPVHYTFTEAGAPTVPVLTTPTAGVRLYGAETFKWTEGPGPSAYELKIGTTGPGSTDIYTKLLTPGITSITGIEFPAFGQYVYAQLLYEAKGKWTAINYRFTEAGSLKPPALKSPSAGTVLNGMTTFTWSAGTGPQLFELRVGTTGLGSTDLLVKEVPSTVTSIANVEIPANGKKVYVQLLYSFNGTWSLLNYSFVEAVP